MRPSLLTEYRALVSLHAVEHEYINAYHPTSSYPPSHGLLTGTLGQLPGVSSTVPWTVVATSRGPGVSKRLAQDTHRQLHFPLAILETANSIRFLLSAMKKTYRAKTVCVEPKRLGYSPVYPTCTGISCPSCLLAHLTRAQQPELKSLSRAIYSVSI